MSETKEEKRIRKEQKKLAKAKKAEQKIEPQQPLENSSSEEKVLVQTESDKNDESSSVNDDLSKRKDLDEIEIDLKGDLPLNKKQQRLLKKGKLNLDKLKKKHPNPVAENEEPVEKEKGKFGVWIGNLSFDTLKSDIITLITSRTLVEESNIKRINIPKGKNDKIKGFCYMDLENDQQVEEIIKLSETNLNGRNLLIKNSKSFEGRPDVPKVAGGNGLINILKNPPSRILFVGNLPFDATDELLREHFKPCGEIVRVRMATFQDTGKCKGFAFLDFKDETGPTNALTSKSTKFFINRPLRMEFGEDRSKRAPKRAYDDINGNANENRHRYVDNNRDSNDNDESSNSTPTQEYNEPRKPRERRDNKPPSNKRLKSSVALATAQRASVAIVPSSGKKTTFD